MKSSFQLVLILLLIMMITSSLQAQEKAREVGVRASGLDDFSLIYKQQNAKGNFTRFRLGVAELNYQEVDGESFFAANGTISIGWERRKEIADRFQFLHGPEPFIGGQYTDSGLSSATVRAGLGYVVGFQYEPSERFYVSLEIIPSVGVDMSFQDNGVDRYRAHGSLSNQSAALVGVYRL